VPHAETLYSRLIPLHEGYINEGIMRPQMLLGNKTQKFNCIGFFILFQGLTTFYFVMKSVIVLVAKCELKMST
jgi:hypothetical protein